MAEQKYLTVRETSRFLRISISTLNRFIRDSRIPSYKVGHRRLFDKDELLEWVKSQGGRTEKDFFNAHRKGT